ncbi:MAG: Smr/MutS family protein, partial [Gemmataceae bacterium]
MLIRSGPFRCTAFEKAVLFAGASRRIDVCRFFPMARKRKSTSHREEPETETSKPVFASPFKDLKKLLARHDAVRSAKPAATPIRAAPATAASSASPADAEVDDDQAMARAFIGVRPLETSRALRIAAEPKTKRDIVSEDAEVIAELSDLVSGQGPFELTETDEYLEGARVGLDPRLVTRLRRGEFSIQGHLDLHGMTQIDAKEALTAFILEAVRKGHRAVLVVHG